MTFKKIPGCAQCGRAITGLQGSELWNCRYRTHDDGSGEPPMEFVCSQECADAVEVKEALEGQLFDLGEGGGAIEVQVGKDTHEVRFKQSRVTAADVARALQTQVPGVVATIGEDGMVELSVDGGPVKVSTGTQKMGFRSK